MYSSRLSTTTAWGSFEDVHDGAATNVELCCQLVDRGADGVGRDQFSDFVRIESMLDLMRSGRSSGWAIAARNRSPRPPLQLRSKQSLGGCIAPSLSSF
jgi:hypothetical protein